MTEDEIRVIQERIDQLKHGSIFTVRELLGEDLWQTIPGNKSVYGRQFKQAMRDGLIAGIECLDDASPSMGNRVSSMRRSTYKKQ